MPNLHLKDQEIDDVISFLSWVNMIDTNNWPPKPMVVSAVSSKSGEAVFKAQGCTVCHMMGGVGGAIGPDLTRVGSRRDRKWIEDQIKDSRLHNPNSIMPSFAMLPEKDGQDLAEYLSGLK